MAVRRPGPGFRLVAWLVIGCVRLMRWRVSVRGLEHVPREGGAVITWNHTSHVDFLLTALDIYRRLDRPVRFLAMRELWRHPLLGWVPRAARAVPIDRTSDDDRDRALRDAVAALQGGDLVMVAPEGTISRSFELLPFRTGAVRMAQLAGVPLVPSASWGSHRLVTTDHPMRLRRAWRIPVDVVFDEPMTVAAEDDPVEATEAVRERTQRLLERLQADYADGAPRGSWWVPARLGGGAPPHAEVLAERRRAKDRGRQTRAS